MTVQAGSSLFLSAQSSIDGALVLANDAAVYANNSAVTISKAVVNGANTTIYASAGTIERDIIICLSLIILSSGSLVEIQNSLVVQAQSSLTLAGDVAVSGAATVDGTLMACRASAESASSHVTFSAGLALSSSGQLLLNASASAMITAQATLDGSVHMAQNTYLFLNAIGSRIANLIVTGINATVQGASGTFSLSFVLSFLLKSYLVFLLNHFYVNILLIRHSGDIMTIGTNLTVAASSSLSLIGQTTVQAALNIFKYYLLPFILVLPLSSSITLPSLCPQSFFYSIASVQGSISFGQSTATSAAVGATVTGSAAVSNGGSLVFYGTNYLTSSVVLYASSILVFISYHIIL